MKIIGFIIGLFVGVLIGVAIIYLCDVASRSDGNMKIFGQKSPDIKKKDDIND